jgi:LacI family transcriptional regulator
MGGFRPAERVRQYLLNSAGDRHSASGGRLPSVRQVARHLGVSTATVQSVFQKLADEGRIRSEVGSGSFWIPAQREEVLQIGLNIPVPRDGLPSSWTYQIYGGIMHGILQSSRPISLRSLPWEALESEESAAGFLEESRHLDGLILFPSQFSRRLRTISDLEQRPVVDLNPSSETATTNFVSPDYYGASRLLSLALRQAGRKRLALLVSPGVADSVSVRLRCAGAAAGLGEALGRGFEMRIFEVGSRDEEAGREAVRRILAEGYRPDSLYCAGDSLAHGAVEALQQEGIAVPEEVSVVGGNGLGLHSGSSPGLTGMRHSLDVLGAELVKMLVHRIEAGGADQPGVYLPPIFNLGATTTVEENALLEDLTR